MKKFFLFLGIIFTCSSLLGQSYMEKGKTCFDAGDYKCAIKNYTKAFKQSSGKNKKIADIHLNRAKNCLENKQFADNEFSAGRYDSALAAYKKIRESNPKDAYVKFQIQQCLNGGSNKTLRKATTKELTDIWNNKYGINPQRRANLIAKGIDPDDAQKRINAGEGKPITNYTTPKKETTLSIEKNFLKFDKYGLSQSVKIYTNASNIYVSLVPSWCHVTVKGNNLTVSCNINYSENPRKDYFRVHANNKTEKVTIYQEAEISQPTSNKKGNYSNYKKTNCFNCPLNNNVFGISLGTAFINNEFPIYRLGLNVEPLFKYGFGLKTGAYFEKYNFANEKSRIISGVLAQNKYNTNMIDYGYYIPLSLEYRLNIHKNFNIYGYGGYGLRIAGDFTEKQTIMEYGFGVRLFKFQFEVGRQKDYSLFNISYMF